MPYHSGQGRRGGAQTRQPDRSITFERDRANALDTSLVRLTSPRRPSMDHDPGGEADDDITEDDFDE